MPSYSVFPCVFLVLFVAKQNFCFPVDSSEEAIKMLEFRKIKNATSNEKRLAKEILSENEKFFNKSQEITDMQMYKKKWEVIVAGVLSLRVLETFFSKNVETYLPAGESGKEYTLAQIRTAYENFLKDPKNEVAKVIRGFLPGKVQEISKAITTLLEKLSLYNQNHYEALKIAESLEGTKKLIQYSPIPLRKDEIELVENIVLIMEIVSSPKM